MHDGQPSGDRFSALSESKRALLRARLEGRAGTAAPALDAIPRRSPGERGILSFAQQRLWFLDQLVPGSPFYTESGAARIKSRIDVPLLERALNRIVERHEVLRTTFDVVDGEPRAAVAPRLHVPLTVIDLSGMPEVQREAKATAIAAEDARRAFDLRAGPLLRASLLALGRDDWMFVFSMHHIVCDGWSSGVLSHELSEIYAASVAGRPCSLPDLPIQYGDFAVWQRHRLRDDLLHGQLAYWREQLADLSALELPTDRPRPASFSYLGRRHTFRLPSTLLRDLERLGQQAGATLFMTLLAGFQILLHRYCAQDDIAVGSPIAGRVRRELEPLIGFFVNVLVMRTNLSGNPSGREVLRRVRETALGAYAHQDLPFEKLVEALQPERDLARNPLFQVIFQLHENDAAARPGAAGALPIVEVERSTVKFDLRVDFFRERDGLRGMIEYSSDLFDADRIQRMGEHLAQIYAELAQAPDRAIGDLRFVRGRERSLLLQRSGDAEAAALDGTVGERFARQVAQRPHATAIVAGDRRISYGELDLRARALAADLRERGVRREDVVAVTARRGAGAVVAELSILVAGAAYLPIDPNDPPERLRYLLENASAKLIVDTDRTDGRLRDFGIAVVRFDVNGAVPAAPAMEPDVTADSLAYVMYTSGSTGKPKGVCVSHRGIVRLVTDPDYCAMGPDEVFLLLAPLTFDASTLEVWGPLLNGGCLAIYEEPHVTPEDLGAVLARHRVTTLWLTAGLFHEIVASHPQSLAGLRQLLVGGDVVSVAHVRALMDEAPECRLINGYGPTENTTFTCCHPIARQDLGRSVPIGRPIRRTRVYVVDSYGELAPLGVPGELCVAGDGLARGYLGDARLTAEKFVPEPYSGRPGRMYRTGDLVRFLAGGELEFLGRIDRQIKVRGFRIEPGEIEDSLSAHPAVREAVVVAAGEAGEPKRLTAYVVRRPPDDGAESEGAVHDPGARLVANWRELYDQLYERPPHDRDPTFDTSGWTASDTGEAIPEMEMREWRDATLARIRAHRPRRVLEIGCGTGLLAFGLIPEVESYVGTDFSATAVGRLEGLVSGSAAEPGRARFLLRDADDLHGIEPEGFDTVILNSVVQYFPSLTYFLRVLEGAVRATAAGGRIFIGDIRSLPLLPVFHAEVQLARAGADLPCSEAIARLEKALQLEQELVIDPALFAALPDRLPGIAGVDLQWKRGLADNELTRYRYDAVLHIGGSAPRMLDARELDWREERLTRKAVERILAEEAPPALLLRRVPNPRLAEAVFRLERLRAAEPDEPVPALRADDPGPSLEEFWRLGERLGYGARIEPELDGDGASCVVEYVRADIEPDANARPRRDRPRLARPLASLANAPLRAVHAAELAPQLRSYLQDRLPDYMQPSHIELVEALPLTRNGKVDRNELAKRARMPSVAPASGREAQGDVEKRLQEIWARLLGRDGIGRNDNFFELGGDSILCLQAVARAKAAGIHFTTRQLFETQTIAGLAAVASEQAGAQADQGAVTGETSLTPAQAWLLAQDLPNLDHFNQSVFLEIPRGLDSGAIEGALRTLVRHHDALRLRCKPNGSGWTAFYVPPDERQVLEHRTLAGSPATLAGAIEDHCGQIQAGLDLANGPVLRAVRFDLGAEQPGRLLLAAHHFVVDGVSWRVLLEDLWTLYSQIAAGQEPALPPKTTSLHAWAGGLSALANSEEPLAELDHWAAVPPTEPWSLPTDRPGPNTVRQSETVREAFSEEETRTLLTDVPQFYRAQINDVLLSAFAKALARWTGCGEAFFDLEGHGREPLLDNVDLSRTVGWLTSIYPVRLTVDSAAGAGATIRSVKSQLQRIPRRGVGYGMLRYLAGASAVRDRLSALPQPQISFNYLGQFGRHDPSATIRGAPESPGPMRDPDAPRMHLIEVDGSVVADRLTFEWTYAGRCFARETVARLVRLFMGEVRDLVADRRLASEAELAASDFPDADLGQDDLDRLLATFAGSEG